jgi:NtrC-family two-component system sensor histidine kinase KinB
VKSLRARFFLAGAAIVLVMAAMGYACAFMFARVSRVVGDELRRDEASAELVTTLTSALEDEDDALLLALSGDHAGADKNRVVEQRRFDIALSDLRANTQRQEERLTLDRLERHVRTFRATGDRLLAQQDGADARAVYDADTTPALRAATTDCARIRDMESVATQRTAAWARDESRRAMTMVGLASAFALALAAGVSVLLARSIVRPISELTKNVEEVRKGDFDRRIAIERDDEIGELAVGYNRMAEALSAFHEAKLSEVVRAKGALEATLSALPDAVLVVGPGGRIDSANPRASELFDAAFGRTPERVSELPTTGDGADVARALAVAPTGGAMDLSRAVRVEVGDGERRFLSRVVPLRGRDGAVVVFRDVTELARIDEMRMDFVAAASHELRTPLTTLSMMLAMIAEGDEKRPPHEEEMLRAALSGCEQLGRTVDGLLDLARAETGNIRLHHERFTAATFAGEVVRTLTPRYADLGVAISVTDETSGADLDGDIARLGVVLSNVLTNALKYSAVGDAVAVRVRERAAMIEIAVTDEGPGVPPEYRSRIFEKYFRVEHHRASEHAPRGAGLGLYLCKQIVEAHAGTIRCDAGANGCGTTISFTVPRRRADNAVESCATLVA